jgi:DNA-binding NarL/FixJ family response regulator
MLNGSQQAGSFAALLRAAQTAQLNQNASLDDQRRLVAHLVRMLGPQSKESVTTRPAVQPMSLSPRLSQTLDGLLAGDSEKQIATKLAISQNTVHVYVKALYKGFGVSSRGELLSRFIDRPNPPAKPVDRSDVLAAR